MELFYELSKGEYGNYIFPFLWMRGEAESVIREEIKRISECGIKAICVEARPHPDFAGPGWWHDLDIVMDEAKSREMRVWVLDDAHFPTGYANGYIESKYPKHKKKYINYNVADVLGAQNEITLNIKSMLKPKRNWLDIGKPLDEEEQKNNKLIGITASRFVRDGIVSESLIDLTDEVDNGFLTYTLPEGQWRIFVVYETRTDGGNPNYINMIDEDSVKVQLEAVYEPHYKRYFSEFGKTFAGFFSDEPSFGNTIGFSFDESIGKKDMPLPYSVEAEEMLKNSLGSEWRSQLVYLWTSTDEMNKCINTRYSYMDIITHLYNKNFGSQLGNWCKERGVEYIGHVIEDNNQHSRLGSGAGHFFRALSGQHMSGIDVIGGQITFAGAGLERIGTTKGDGEFYHYALGKMGSSLGHLDPKKSGRTMCELFGAYGWKLGVRDMKYILDHLIVRGINYLVPHAFSMRDYPDLDCPPHFYARGNNPQFKYFSYLMHYANRMCHIFNGGIHIAPVAILYHGESEWTGNYMKMQKPARALSENQIDFDFVSMDILNELTTFNGKINDRYLEINNEKFECLVIPYSEYITKELALFISNNPQLEIIFVDGKPSGISNEIDVIIEKELLDSIEVCKVVGLDKLATGIRKNGIYDISLKQPFKELTYYHYVKESNIYMFQNESAYKIFSGEIELTIDNSALIYRGLENKFEELSVKNIDGKSVVFIELKPYESIVIFDMKTENIDQLREYIPSSIKYSSNNNTINLSNDWKYSLAKNIDYPQFGKSIEMDELVPISSIDPKFAGIIKYEKSFKIEDIPDSAILIFENVYEAMELWINEENAGMKVCPPYFYEVEKYLKNGENTIKIEVSTTLDRDKLNYPEPQFTITHEPMDPTGMFGEVKLQMKFV